MNRNRNPASISCWSCSDRQTKLLPVHAAPLLAAAAAFLWLGTSGALACLSLDVSVRGSGDSANTSRRDFRPNEQVVICVQLQEGAWVSIWDAPDRGDPERLFPNRITDPPKGKRAAWLDAGKTHCFGIPGTFPIYIPPEEGKGGLLTFMASLSEKKHPADEDAQMPGTTSPDAFHAATRSYRSNAGCGEDPLVEVRYTVTVSR